MSMKNQLSAPSKLLKGTNKGLMTIMGQLIGLQIVLFSFVVQSSLFFLGRVAQSNQDLNQEKRRHTIAHHQFIIILLLLIMSNRQC